MDSIVILFEQHLLDISPTELEELFSPASEYINHVIFNLRSHLVTLSPDLKQNGEQLFDFLTQNATCQSHLNVLSRLLIDSQIPRKSLMTTLVQIVDQLIFTLADLDDEFVEQHGGLETVVKLATTLSEISLSSFTHPLCLESLQTTPSLSTDFTDLRSISAPISANYFQSLSHTVIDKVRFHQSRLQHLTNIIHVSAQT
ncbi:hypothetical protein BLNAU_3424 [Blattamonas nauphoetae]|uniref:Uncharacterized protein n=1 Tax=Blattamonas nauphoetae TaxID=2049346 RepID=A0ABQ9YD97_9EUKA|nr:hypothetical protein BLNAU_3424 [Blattamonas nauphoetae]